MNMKEEIEENAEELYRKLKEQRDELNLHIHLAGMDVRDEWEELEKKWDHFKIKSRHVAREAEPSVDEIGTALSLLGEEIRSGYRRIKDAIED